MHPEQQLSIARNSEGATSMAVISPLGGALLKLSLQGTPIIDSTDVVGLEEMFFGSILAPWPNRLADHTYSFSGQTFSTPNVDSDNNSNHGLVFNQEFDLVSHSADSLELRYQLGQDHSYPFDVELSVRYEIFSDSFRVLATAFNRGVSAPFGLGFHPYYSVGKKFRVHSGFDRQILTNEKMIPVASRAIDGLEYTGGALDDCFSGSKQVKLDTEDYSVSISLDEGFDYFMLYRPSESVGKSLLAIEPMSCLTNAFNSDPDSVLLQSGETKKFAFSVRKN
jgi:aldose 1-epimerase